ncbi:MAG: uroporphyrinogen decarboxylase family protein [Actinobacteria bacterium]|nr:uroporphyrinogen decarboxylase family protein [Actinomycetota bacterium]
MERRPRMTSKERVLKAYRFERPDRVPIDFCACVEVYDKLRFIQGGDR